MAQAGLRSFYPVRRRREDDTQTAVKRRKLTETSHLEVSADKERLDTMITLDTSDLSNGEISAIAKKPTTRSRKAGSSLSTARKNQSGRGKRSKKGGGASKDIPNIKTLFEIINHTTGVNDEAPHTHTTTTASDKLSDESPLPKTSSSTSESRPLVVSHPGHKSSQEKTTPRSSPFKVPATPPKAASSPVPPRSSTCTTSSPIPESRGARLLRMAQERMSAKSPVSKEASHTCNNDSSPSKSVTVERSARMAARRKLLTNPDLPSTSSSKSAAKFFPSKEQDRQEMVGELYKLSKRELAQPTRYESAKVKRGKKASSSEKEESGVKTPKLREFGAFEFESPTKNEPAKTRYIMILFIVVHVYIIFYSLSPLPPLTYTHIH